mmetsp:Transcript_41102/g.75200  ORF Transcript_41102/g.75200 Transcript_41102/m.75200 type:complete len:293 (+) Transcript_41102:98-976(+)
MAHKKSHPETEQSFTFQPQQATIMANKEVTGNEEVPMITMLTRMFPLIPHQVSSNSTSPVASVQILLATFLAYCSSPTIPMRDILFCVLFPAYLLLANHLRFGNNLLIRQRSKDHPHNISVIMSKFFSGSDSKWFQNYIFIAATCGLILPLITVIRASEEVAMLAVPHLFVLWCQIIGESVVMFNPFAYRFITLLLPIGFSVYRMHLLVEWFFGSVSLIKVASATENVSVWYTWGLALSSLNLVFWTYNLLVTLLLRVTPEFLGDEKCESPDVRVISIPFIKEPKKETAGKK